MPNAWQTSEGFLHVYKIERNVGPPLEIPLAKCVPARRAFRER